MENYKIIVFFKRISLEKNIVLGRIQGPEGAGL